MPDSDGDYWYYNSASSGTCTECADNCQTCTGANATDCTACITGYMLKTDDKVCTVCSTGCDECNATSVDGSECSACDPLVATDGCQGGSSCSVSCDCYWS